MVFAAIDGILLPFLVARVVVIVANLDGYGVVILFDTPRNLLKQLLLKRFSMFQACFLILVFCFEISNNLRVFALVEPIVVVDTGMAMYRHLMGMDGGFRGSQRVIHCRAHQNENVKPKVGRMGSWRAIWLVTILT